MKSVIIPMLMLSTLISAYAQQTQNKSKNDSTTATDFTESTGSNRGLTIRSISGIIPLYVVDDVAITAEQVKHINPDKIESIRVLKDAKSIELYGEKGKNGVILISMKDSIKIPQKN